MKCNTVSIGVSEVQCKVDDCISDGVGSSECKLASIEELCISLTRRLHCIQLDTNLAKAIEPNRNGIDRYF